MTTIETELWTEVCDLTELIPDRGMCALVNGEQVALFRVSPDDEVFAIANRDPFSGAPVLSRGLLGDRNGVTKVASPIYKQSFDLRTGVCLDDPEVSVPVYEVRVADGRISVRVPS
jgi:nitrite reductase (NADH) small subunit